MPEKSDATRRLTMSCSEDSEVLSIETGRDETSNESSTTAGLLSNENSRTRGAVSSLFT